MRGTTHQIDCPYWPTCHYTCWAWEAMNAHLHKVHVAACPAIGVPHPAKARRCEPHRERLKNHGF